jgi:hypothetical protein
MCSWSTFLSASNVAWLVSILAFISASILIIHCISIFCITVL